MYISLYQLSFAFLARFYYNPGMPLPAEWKPVRLANAECDSLAAARRTHDLEWAIQTGSPDPRFDVWPDSPTRGQRTMFEHVHHFTFEGLLVYPEVLDQWALARVRLEDWVDRSQPQVVLIAGNSGKEILTRTFGLRENFLSIPLMVLDGYGRWALYKHSIGEWVGDDTREVRYFAKTLTDQCGAIPQHILVLDDVVKTATKAFLSWQTLRRAGVATVSSAPFLQHTKVNLWVQWVRRNRHSLLS